MITMEKILVPVDFFPASDAAVLYAAGLAANYDAAVHLLHVITPIAPAAYEYAIDTAEITKSM
jgi:nucleotide-binding universal stress UspA family protein